MALLAALLLGGCADLETGYAALDGDSVNGVRRFHDLIAQGSELHRAPLLTPRLAEGDCRLLVHVARRGGQPDAAAVRWLDDWLDDESGRTVLVVLRDGNLAPWLCRRWAGEARAEALRVPEQAAGLDALAERLERRAEREAEPPAVWREADPLVPVRARPPVRPLALQGPGGALAVPEAMQLGLVLDGTGAQALFRATLPDGTQVPWALVSEREGSRLVVVAGATALLDGALPDAKARQLAAALVQAVVTGRPRAAWVSELRVRSGEPEPGNPVALLLTRPPVSWAAWHLLALAALALAGSALWVGRREPPRPDRRARFGLHLDALARHLREGRHVHWCLRTIARLRGLPPTPARCQSAAEARAWLARQAADTSPSPHAKEKR